MRQFVQHHYMPSKRLIRSPKLWREPYVSKLTRVPPPPTPTGECSLQQKFLVWPITDSSRSLSLFSPSSPSFFKYQFFLLISKKKIR